MGLLKWLWVCSFFFFFFSLFDVWVSILVDLLKPWLLFCFNVWVLFTGDDGTDKAREVETFFWVWVSALGERQG